jgi:DNA-binding HxlR family transcriptional regulator
MLAAPLNASILYGLADGAQQQSDLRRKAGLPAQTTLRAQLKRLGEIGVIDKHRRNRFPGVLEYELSSSGRDLLFVLATLDAWLDTAPEVPLSLGDNAAKAAIKALAAGWSTTMLRALAAAPLSLTELDDLIGSLSYPSLERRLAAMRLAGQIVARPGDGRGTPYAVTDWLRRGTAPLVAAARWERCHRPQASPPFYRLDAEAAFLLTTPLLNLPSGLSGTCRMAMEVVNGSARRLAGVRVEVRDGRVVSCTTQLEAEAGASALGSPAAWLAAVIERDLERLELAGDGMLARTMLEHLHRALFGSVKAEDYA